MVPLLLLEDDEIFFLLYDAQRRRGAVTPRRRVNPHRFNLNEVPDDECSTMFRFDKDAIYRLHHRLRMKCVRT